MRAIRTSSLVASALVAGLLLIPGGASAQPRLTLSTSGGYSFPILFTSTGGLLDEGLANQYESTYELYVDDTPSDLLEAGVEADPEIIFGGRMILMAPTLIGDYRVRREIYVPAMGGNWARYTDVIINISSADRQVDIEGRGQFACCGNYVDSSDGDMGYQETDIWFVVDDQNLGLDTAKGTVVYGVDAPSGPPPIADGQTISSRARYSYAWLRQDVAPDGRLVFLTYALQHNNRAIAADAAAELTDPRDDGVAMFDLDPYIDDVANFDLRESETAPECRFNAPRVIDEGEAFSIGVNCIDPSSTGTVTWSWDLDDDGVFGEMPGVSVIDVPAGSTDGSGIYRATVEAILGAGTPREGIATRTVQVSIRNVAPTITSSPPTEAVLGAEYEYLVTVDDPGGAFDPAAFTLPSAPEGARTELVSPQTAIVKWRPGNLDVTGPGESILFQLLVDDGDGGQATQTWALRVEDNRTPEAPIPVFPVAGIGLEDPQPRLAVANAEDPDFSDRLVYFFEIDTVDTFEGVNLRRSGPVAELPGFTFWIVEPELEVGRYFWRSKASDGSLDSDWVEAEFWVLPEPVDGGQPRLDAGPPPGVGGDSGGCAVSDRQGGALPLIALVGLGLVLGVRRRRRR